MVHLDFALVGDEGLWYLVGYHGLTGVDERVLYRLLYLQVDV